MIISTPNRIGRAISWAEARMTAGSPGRPCRRRSEFSIITTAPSAIIPKSMAPKLIRLALTPNSAMPMKPKSIDKGMTAATIKAARILPRKSMRTVTTKSPASSKLRRTVAIVMSITSLWS